MSCNYTDNYVQLYDYSFSLKINKLHKTQYFV